MNLGVRAHDFGKNDVEVLVKKVSGKGFKSIQLALNKAIKGIDNPDGILSPGLAVYIRNAFNKNNINIAVLGCYINPIHPDKEERKKVINRFKEHIRYARDFGCSVIGTETGSINADCSYNPGTYTRDVFNDFTNVINDLVEEAEKFGVFVGIEPVADIHTINTPERMKELLDNIKSNNLQVIFDPVNLIAENQVDNQTDIIKKSFDLFGDKIAVIHVKDFIIKDGKKNGNLPSGKGIFNLDFFIRLCKQRKPYINFLLENNNEDSIDESINYVKNIYDKY